MDSEQLVYLNQNEGVTGPFELREVLSFLSSGAISSDILVSVGDGAEWMPLLSFAPAETFAVSQKSASAKTKRQQIVFISLLIVLAVLAGLFATLYTAQKKEMLANSSLTESAISQLNIFKEQQAREAAAAKTKEKRANDAEKAQSEKLVGLSKQLDAALNDISKKDTRIRLLEDLARDYADRFLEYKSAVYGVAQIPEKAVLHVKVDNEGPLHFDVDTIKASIANELVSAGFILIDKDEESSSRIAIFATIAQLEISKGTQSAYRCEFVCFARCLRGDKIKAYHLFGDATFGYAGSKSTYMTSTKEFFSSAAVKCISAINEAKKDAVAGDDPLSIYNPLVAAKVPLTRETAKTPNKIIGSGSGIVIGSRPLVLTNHHVVREGSSITLYFESGLSMEAVVIASNVADDLAVLTTKEKCDEFVGQKFADFSDPSDLSIGADIYSLGFPLTSVLGLELKYSSGTVSSTKGMKDQKSEFQHSIPTQPGNSGGPVFFKSGQLAGLIVSTLKPIVSKSSASTIPQNVNYAIRIDTIINFLRANRLLEEINAEQASTLELDAAKKLVVRIETSE